MQVHLEIERGLQEDLEFDVVEALEPQAKVFIHNDDVTPYEFVIVILQKIFGLTSLEAEHVTFIAHTAGIAYVATFPKAEAQKRVGKAQFAANLEGFPLSFTIEMES
ncbi:MAG: ATP-dependent Clp protease adaptor ClpS [Anaerolineales bacterium]|nr:ATP-dependent Clp protease adaptor ClpS [Anaerolineales bacterium]MCB8991448.1 ATP-dependent Clp protease adaptor ClpS [Ardenticatenaceae bacterium]MCB9003932.1 ATP-dependent Clp protease adaptor ClpS [Ardenticatenaceae bacterium]